MKTVIAALVLLTSSTALADSVCKRGELTQVQVVQKLKAHAYEVQNWKFRQDIVLFTNKNFTSQGYACVCASPGKDVQLRDNNGFPVRVPSLKDVGVPKDACANGWAK